MSARSPASDIFPVAAAGLALLALGGLLLLIGNGVAVGNPSEFDTWLVGVGLVVLLGAMLIVLIRSNPPPAKPPKRETSVAAPHPAPRTVSPPAAANGPVEPPAETSTPGPVAEAALPVATPAVEAPAVELPTRAPFAGSTSIPAQYEGVRQSLPDSAPPRIAWEDDAADGVLLPFSAGGIESSRGLPHPASAPEMVLAFPPVDYLEQEVARLREKVHALQRTGPPAAKVVAPAPAPPAMTAAPPRTDAPRPPEPPSGAAIGSRRLCVSCGSGLPGGTTDPLCWGCGRPLCSTCYWRATEGAAAHTCPSCFARAGTTSRSGGRGPTASPPIRVAANPRPKAATAPR
jgi:hypothetical protein